MIYDMKKYLRVFVASVLSLPFVLGILAYLIVLLCRVLDVNCPHLIETFLLNFCMWSSQFPLLVLPILALASIAVLDVWRQKAKSRFEITCAVVYSSVILLHVAFALWGLVTKPSFDV